MNFSLSKYIDLWLQLGISFQWTNTPYDYFKRWIRSCVTFEDIFFSARGLFFEQSSNMFYATRLDNWKRSVEINEILGGTGFSARCKGAWIAHDKFSAYVLTNLDRLKPTLIADQRMRKNNLSGTSFSNPCGREFHSLQQHWAQAHCTSMNSV